MNEKARKVITRLSATQREDYEEVKKQVLREFKMIDTTSVSNAIHGIDEGSEGFMDAI